MRSGVLFLQNLVGLLKNKHWNWRKYTLLQHWRWNSLDKKSENRDERSWVVKRPRAESIQTCALQNRWHHRSKNMRWAYDLKITWCAEYMDLISLSSRLDLEFLVHGQWHDKYSSSWYRLLEYQSAFRTASKRNKKCVPRVNPRIDIFVSSN